jgi:hypothetical protein
MRNALTYDNEKRNSIRESVAYMGSSSKIIHLNINGFAYYND